MSTVPETRPITARHYQALCGLALTATFLLLLPNNSTLIINLAMLLLGSFCILVRIRLSPLLVFVVFAAGQMMEQVQTRNYGSQRFRLFNLDDVMLCMTMLTYLIGQYRLNGLRFGVLVDARAAANPVRSEASLTSAELVGLIFPVPIAALIAQFAMLVLANQWGPSSMGQIWRQLFTVAWTLLLGIFLAAHAFRYWRRLQMTRALALLMLQDILWNEIGGESARIERWSAWRKRSP